jgi:hypothetical protein
MLRIFHPRNLRIHPACYLMQVPRWPNQVTSDIETTETPSSPQASAPFGSHHLERSDLRRLSARCGGLRAHQSSVAAQGSAGQTSPQVIATAHRHRGGRHSAAETGSVRRTPSTAAAAVAWQEIRTVAPGSTFPAGDVHGQLRPSSPST